MSGTTLHEGFTHEVVRLQTADEVHTTGVELLV